MNYEIENALRNKVDNWEINSLKQRVDQLANDNRDLQEKLSRTNSKLQNHYSAINRLIQILIESDRFTEEDQFFEIKQYLY